MAAHLIRYITLIEVNNFHISCELVFNPKLIRKRGLMFTKKYALFE